MLKLNPNDELKILQYLLLKFYPLIIKTSKKYSKMLRMDWSDTVAFTKHAFVELIYRFDLSSTLYFKAFMPLALKRALYDYFLYIDRRSAIYGAQRLDSLPLGIKESVIHDSQKFYSTENKKQELQDFKAEIKELVITGNYTELQKNIFLAVYFHGLSINEAAKKYLVKVDEAKEQIFTIMTEVKEHTREFLEDKEIEV